MDATDPFDAQEAVDGRPRRPSLETISAWFVLAGLAVFSVTLWLAAANIRKGIAQAQADLAPLRSTLTRATTPEPKVLELMNTLAQIETSIKEVQAVRPTIAASQFDWSAIMAAIGSHDPSQLTLLSLTYGGNEVTLKGRAASDVTVANYARSLERTNLFARVVVQSIKAVATPAAPPSSTPTAQPTPPPTATPSPSHTPTLTPTPDRRDAYEPDDGEPRDIFLGQPQVHNFCPADDVDQVRFLAKAGRHYRVVTTDLAPGVDTVLTVRVGDAVHTNDDCKPGTLRSEVTFRAPAGSDVEAVVEVRNRGSYGPEMSYRLAVEEMIPTATPLPPVTRTPLPTNTPRPSPTSTLTATHAPLPTATPAHTAVTTAAGGAAAARALASDAATARGGSSLPLRPAGLAFPAAARGHLSLDAEAVEFVILLVLRTASR